MEKAYEIMAEQKSASRPNTRIPVALSISLAVGNALSILALAFSGMQMPNTFLTAVFIFAVVTVLSLCALQLLSARMIAQYKRAGLRLGIIVNGFGILSFLCSINTSPLSLINAVILVATLVVLAYVYRYYTQEPYKSFFT